MTHVQVVPATPDHVLELAPRLRLADAREIWAANKSTPHRGLLASMRRTRQPWAGLADGRCECIFGVAPLAVVSPAGSPWLLGSDEIERHATRFLRMSQRYIAAIRHDYRLLVNYVDSRNTAAIQWLNWLGFDIMAAEPYGPFGVPFHRFEMRS
ncbi:MAG: hypothetical protein VW338_09160 [Rhodospirillaceae bacterium]